MLLLGISLVGGLSLSEFLIRWFAPQELTSVGFNDPTGLRIVDPKFVFCPQTELRRALGTRRHRTDQFAWITGPGIRIKRKE